MIARRVFAEGARPAGEIVARAPVLEGVALLEGIDRPGPFSLEGAATPAPLTVSLLSEAESDVAKLVEPVRMKVSARADAKPTNAEEARVRGARAKADLRWLIAALAALFLAFDALWLTRKGKRAIARLGRKRVSSEGNRA